jgi:hypothetical protein
MKSDFCTPSQFFGLTTFRTKVFGPGSHLSVVGDGDNKARKCKTEELNDRQHLYPRPNLKTPSQIPACNLKPWITLQLDLDRIFHYQLTIRNLTIAQMSTLDDEKLSDIEKAPVPTGDAPEILAVQPEPSTDNSGVEPAAASTDAETEEQEWVTGLKLAVIVAAISMAAFLMLLDVSIVATVSPSYPTVIELKLIVYEAVPRITSDFHSLTDIGWYGSAYLLAK